MPFKKKQLPGIKETNLIYSNFYTCVGSRHSENVPVGSVVTDAFFLGGFEAESCDTFSITNCGKSSKFVNKSFFNSTFDKVQSVVVWSISFGLAVDSVFDCVSEL